MPQTRAPHDYAARHARWQTMVRQWRCSYCPCTNHQRTVLNPTCQSCKHIHLMPARDRVLPLRRPTPAPPLPLLGGEGETHG
jgi:hypothetical protein